MLDFSGNILSVGDHVIVNFGTLDKGNRMFNGLVKYIANDTKPPSASILVELLSGSKVLVTFVSADIIKVTK